MMQKEVGKVYHNERTWVLCTGAGKSDNTFSVYVVKQLDPTSELNAVENDSLSKMEKVKIIASLIKG